MHIIQLPVSENPLPQEREAYLLVEIYSVTNFKHMELEGVDPTFPRTPHNFHLMFTTFSKRLCHALYSLYSIWGTHVLQQEGHFQAEGLPKLETDEINKSWWVVQPFQIPPCETGFHNGMVNGLLTLKRPLLKGMKVPDGLFHLRLYPSCLISMSTTKDTRSSNIFILLSHTTLSSNHPLIWTGSHLGISTLSLTTAKSSIHPSRTTGTLPLTITIMLFSTKTPSIKTHDTP